MGSRPFCASFTKSAEADSDSSKAAYSGTNFNHYNFLFCFDDASFLTHSFASSMQKDESRFILMDC